MSHMGIEPTPPIDDVRQYPTRVDPHTVPVSIKEPVPVRLMPGLRGFSRTYPVDILGNIAPNNMNEILPGDPRIKSAILVASLATIWVGTLEEVGQPNGPSGFLMPANTPVPWDGFETPLYAVSTVGAGTVAVRYTLWGD